MPFGNAQSLTNDELYAITAYVLYLNDVIKDENFELNDKTFTSIKLPNQPNFIDDDREVTEKEFWRASPCMTNCAAGRSQDRRPRPRARRDAGDRQGAEGRVSVMKRHAVACPLALAAAMWTPAGAVAADKAFGEYLSSECVTCHQISGRYEGIPPIVGWPEPIFIEIMDDYRQKKRANPIMQTMAQRAFAGRNRRAGGVFREPFAGRGEIIQQRKYPGGRR